MAAAAGSGELNFQMVDNATLYLTTPVPAGSKHCQGKTFTDWVAAGGLSNPPPRCAPSMPNRHPVGVRRLARGQSASG